jgi:enamine deaminase RidA (YjgF/YER057c/UK114 family)
MATKYIQPEKLFKSRLYGFSHVAISEGTRFINVAGQVAWDEHQNIIGVGDIKQQAIQALNNVKVALLSAGADLENVSSMRIYVVQYKFEYGMQISDALKEFFSPEMLPASTWIGVSSLAMPEFLVEIEVTAVV